MDIRITTLIFDLDGTLVDSSEDITRCANMALQQMGFPPITVEQTKRAIGPGDEKFTRLMLPPGKENKADEFLKLYREFYLTGCTQATKVYPGVKQGLRYLSKFKLVLTTNKPRYMAEKILAHFGLQEYFRLCLGPEDVSNVKPDPEMIRKALTLLAEPPQRAMVVGDTYNDIIAGKRAGTKTCAVTYGYSSRKSLEEEKPDFIIEKFDDLIGLIDGKLR